MTFRAPMDTVQEFEPVEIAYGEGLDVEASRYGVARMYGEPDSVFRERVRVAMNVKRASERADRGESLIPPDPRTIALAETISSAHSVAWLFSAEGESEGAVRIRRLRKALEALEAASR